MATNKHAIMRYQALDKCFSNRYRKFFIEDLVEACNDALSVFYTSKENKNDNEPFYVKKRTIFSDIQYMESLDGWNAEIMRVYEGKRCYYRYKDENFSINKREFSEAELDKLDEAMIMLNRFKGIDGFDWIDEFVTNFEDKLGRKKNEVPVIGYERNQYLTGLKYMSELYHHIIAEQPLEIIYEPFGKDERVLFFHPYYLKQYNNRWFLLGVEENDHNLIVNVPLDRIKEIKASSITYAPNTQFDFEEYFDDVIGVSVPREGKVEDILLQFSEDRFRYVDTKPIHPSQIVDREKHTVKITVMRNRELDAQIMYFGEDVEVLEPTDYREYIKGKVKKLARKYALE